MAKDKEDFLTVLDGVMGNISSACKARSMSRQTFYNWMKNEDFALEVKNIGERRHDNVESALMKAALEGNVTAQIFYLKTQCKDRGYIENQKIEIEGAQAITWNETKTYVKPD